jgi:hypothetical protein
MVFTRLVENIFQRPPIPLMDLKKIHFIFLVNLFEISNYFKPAYIKTLPLSAAVPVPFGFVFQVS